MNKSCENTYESLCLVKLIYIVFFVALSSLGFASNKFARDYLLRLIDVLSNLRYFSSKA